jgi:5'-nucleotidase
VNLARQQAKIVSAINGLGADVVSLEEIENSAKFGEDRDAAVKTLVAGLNDAAGAGTWSYVPTPSTAGDQTDEDVIRTAFIYRSAVVKPIGESVIDDAPEFDVARDPLAQAFQPVGETSASRFAVIVNHFKSKGSGPDDGTGQGNSNPQRVAQAQQLVTFADQVKADFGTDRLFLSGDFNAYTQEDPLQVLYAAGYTDIGSNQSPGEHTYLFDGVVGSLDHVLANQAALGTVTGAHVWNINSVEPVALEYSRYNYNATNFYEANPFRASDHDPLLVGIDTSAAPVATSTTAQVSPDPVPVAKKDSAPGVVTVQVTSPKDVVDAGTVEVYDGATLLGTATVSASGVATVTLPAYKHKGGHTLTVRYEGTELYAPSETTVSFTVGNK